jgi:YesN/AraC family two-component response regulator
MPGLNGIEVFKKLKSANVRSKFCILTGAPDSNDEAVFLSLGGFAFLAKPFDTENAEPALEKLYRSFLKSAGASPLDTLITTGIQPFDDMTVYIERHLGEDYSFSSLSGKWGIPADQICALFAEHYQSSLTIFVKNARMREAARLLAETDSATKKISGLVGFTSYFVFVKLFRAHFGVTPSEYREKAAEKAI